MKSRVPFGTVYNYFLMIFCWLNDFQFKHHIGLIFFQFVWFYSSVSCYLRLCKPPKTTESYFWTGIWHCFCSRCYLLMVLSGWASCSDRICWGCLNEILFVCFWCVGLSSIKLFHIIKWIRRTRFKLNKTHLSGTESLISFSLRLAILLFGCLIFSDSLYTWIEAPA